ncbi:hypothetical protein C8J56DRAFT_1167026 [Mycena floridula]|nr:hypothetical protein C8J56DRAFT_1167026 [Mycena floridula]
MSRPRNLEKLMSESRQGSLIALSMLSRYLGSDIGLTVEALSIAFQHLSIADIPSRGLHNFRGDLTIVYLQLLQSQIFSARSSILSLSPVDRASMETLSEKLSYPAAAFLLDRLQQGINSAEEWDFQHDIHSTIISIVDFAISNQAARTALVSRAGFVMTVLRIWVLEIGISDARSPSAGEILGFFAMTGYDNVPFPTGILGSDREMVSFVLDRLDEQLHAKNPDSTLILGIVTLINRWCQNIDINDSFIDAGSIPSVCNVLRQFSTSKILLRLPEPSRASFVFHLIFESAMTYLIFCIDIGGSQVAAKAIDYRVLLSLVRSPQVLLREKNPETEATYTRLFRTLERYLVYPRILRRAEKSIRAIRRLGLDISPSGETDNFIVFLDIWKSFLSSVEVRIAFRRQRDLHRLLERLRCHNPSHNKVGSSDDNLGGWACSGCGDTYYCSRACQKAHWKAGEENICNMKRDLQLPAGLDRRSDYLFFSDMVKYDALKASENGTLYSAVKLYHHEHPQLDPNTFVALLDYTAGPYTLTILSETKFHEHKLHSEKDEQMFDMIQTAKRGSGMIVAAQIPIALSMLMAESRKGSIIALSQLSEAFDSNAALFVEALPIVFRHLRIAEIPPEPVPWAANVKNAEAGRIAIMCLQILRDHLFSPAIRPTVRSALLANIDKLRPLAEFLLGRLQRGSCSAAEQYFRQDMHDITVNIFFVLGSDPASRTMVSEPSMVAILCQIWVLEVGLIVSTKSTMTVLASVAMNEPDSVAFPEGVLGSKEELASFLLDQIDDRCGKLQLNLIQNLIVLLQEWSLQDICFVQAGSIQSVCNVLRRLSSSKTFPQLYNDPVNASILPLIYQYSLHYLTFCIEVGGPQAAAKAIDHRLVLSLVRSREIIHRQVTDDPSMETDFADLFRAVETYLVFPEVLRRATKSIKTIRRRKLEAPCPDETSISPGFLTLWEDFVSAVEDRADFKDKWDRWRRSKSLHCHNPSHDELGSPSNICRLCPRCLDTYYCSRTCQKAHWKTGEDITCKQKTDSERRPSGLQRSDYIFLCAMVDNDLKRVVEIGHFSYARDLYLREHPEVDPKTLVVLLDYFEGPCTFSIISEAELRDTEHIAQAREYTDRERGIIEAARNEKGFYLVVSKIRVTFPWRNVRLLPIDVP